MTRDELTLADREDTFHFTTGMPLVWDGHGFRRETRRERISSWLRHKTRWFRSRAAVTEIDHENGMITVGRERWSWLRWRWEAM